MKSLLMRPLAALALCLGVAAGLGVPPAHAQSTTGNLAGIVSDESGGVLPGATVTAVHEPTGTRYSDVTSAGGEFDILNVRVGGPYTVTATLSGFKEITKKDIVVRLGDQTAVEFRLPLQAMTEEVTVSAEAGIINPSSNGPATSVSQETIDNLPTIARGLEDFARLSPYFDATGSGDGTDRAVLSVAGRNNRYNNLQIDGSVNNDLFAISDSSAPGNASDGQPISIDAIEELQLLVAPYDVRQGGFTGGGINAVTRSGSNKLRGTAYYYFRNDSFTGDGPDDRPLATFSDKNFGASVGGPIKQDRVFFFVNAELGRRETPSGVSADGNSGQPFGREAEVARFLDILRTRYQYDPGGTAEFIRDTPSTKILGKLDFNLSSSHRLTLRHNFVKGETDRGFPTTRTYYFPDNWYQQKDNNHSSVAQLNSTFGTLVNEFRVSYQRLRLVSDGPTRFPQVIVDVSGSGQLRAGRENFRAANQLDQDIIELNDDISFRRGKHLITVGTHNEFFKFRNLFIRDNTGSYRFSSLDNFAAGVAQQYDLSYSLTGDPLQAAKFKVQQFGFYVGDLWKPTARLTINPGLRIDLPRFPEKPTRNPAAEAAFGFRTDVVPSPKLISPRVGFNYDIAGDAKSQVRGGIGIFTGRTPYVWLSNQYGNTGIEFQRIGASFNANNRIPFVPNPDAQPRTVVGAAGSAFNNEVDVVDPDYKFPQVLRTNLAYDRELGIWGLLGTAEVVYTKNRQDIDYQNLNRVPGTAVRSDGRPVFVVANRAFGDVILLTNTDQGRQWTSLLKLERPYRDGLYVSASWLYGESTSVSDGGSSQAASNWGNVYVPGDPNHAPLARSNFDPGHRLNAAVSKDFKLGGLNTVVSLFYNGQSGRPYTYNYNGDANGDGRTANDLIFVPANQGDVIVTNGTWEQLDAYIKNDPALKDHRGQIVPRNAGRSPWANQVDLKLAVKVPARRVGLEITGDLINVLNLIDSKKGVFDIASFNDLNPIGFSVDAATGKYTYNLATINAPTFVKFNRDDLRSRWQAQLGFRVRY
jgi:hypothetical protein